LKIGNTFGATFCAGGILFFSRFFVEQTFFILRTGGFSSKNVFLQQ